MYISIADAQGKLLELLWRAGSGEEVILTHEGKSVGKIEAFSADRKTWSAMSPEERKRALDDVIAGAPKLDPREAGSASNHDFLYDEDGLPA